MNDFNYSGDELQVFAFAKNWKAYWLNEVRPFIGEAILEVGAGIGSTARTLGAHQYKSWVCLEPDPKLCDKIRKEVSVGNLPDFLDIRMATTENLKSSDMFDTVLYIDVLEHIEDDSGELRRIAGNLIDGGKVIIVSPAHNFLYTDFDKKIGHYRRYSSDMLKSIVPSGMIIKKIHYLDSVGLLASLANKLFLKSGNPTHGQVQLWDRLMVKTSRILDPILGYRLGKSVICVLEKTTTNARELIS